MNRGRLTRRSAVPLNRSRSDDPAEEHEVGTRQDRCRIKDERDEGAEGPGTPPINFS